MVKRQYDTQIEIFHPAICFWAGPGGSRELQPRLPHVGGRELSTWAFVGCFPLHISPEADQKPRNWILACTSVWAAGVASGGFTGWCLA